jgi:hypothetical protein
MKRLLLITLLAAPALAHADEGMWTFNNFPKAAVEKAHGFTVTDAWLDHLRLSSARLAQGCSASFVSERGLILTNHHCARGCIEQLSGPGKDYVADGFLAKAPGDELKCPALEVNQLVRIQDVTARLVKATEGLEGEAFNDAQRAEMAHITKACQTDDSLRCDVVTLYQGGRYDLYTYKRYQDVRLVMAPEEAIAFFGGDPDNFMFPRYDLDVSFVRVYEKDAPARTPHFLAWSADGTRDGDLTFVSGHPGGTQRLLTVAELEYQRDSALPERLIDLAEYRGLLTEYARRGVEQARHSRGLLFGVENSLKALRGRREAIEDKAFFATKVAAETAFRAELAKDAARAKALPAFDAIAAATTRLKAQAKRYAYQGGGAFAGRLFRIARGLVRAGDERPKANEKRLPEFGDAALPALTQGLFSPAPIYDELEIFQLTWSLTKLRERLGPDDPYVKKVLGLESPGALATRLVKGTRLQDVAVRKRLWSGGKAAVAEAAREDPFLALAIEVDEDGRAIRKKVEDEIESVQKKNAEVLARARFAVYGTSTYPDATFTLRLSYGRVTGWPEAGAMVAPVTTLAGAFERHTGRDPFALPKSWLDARARLDLKTPFNVVTTNDIIGGNSGSPLVNKAGEVVGLVFDGNIWSLGGEFGFDEATNRTVSVESTAIIEALQKIYGAQRIVAELRPAGR